MCCLKSSTTIVMLVADWRTIAALHPSSWYTAAMPAQMSVVGKPHEWVKVVMKRPENSPLRHPQSKSVDLHSTLFYDDLCNPRNIGVSWNGPSNSDRLTLYVLDLLRLSSGGTSACG